MPIDNFSSSLASLLPPPDPQDVTPVASRAMRQPFEEHLLALCRIPVGAGRSPTAAREAERLYELASPIRHWLENPNDGLSLVDVRDRMGDIVTLAIQGRLPLEHARRLLVPSEPSWLHDLNTPDRVHVAYMLIGVIARRTDLTDAEAAIGRALLRQLLEIEGESPSRVLLSMDLCHMSAFLPELDHSKCHLASQLHMEMTRLHFTEAEIRQATDVPRRRHPSLAALFAPQA